MSKLIIHYKQDLPINAYGKSLKPESLRCKGIAAANKILDTTRRRENILAAEFIEKDKLVDFKKSNKPYTKTTKTQLI